MRPLLVLDLDETLIYAALGALPRPADFRVGPYSVYIRPYAAELLHACDDVFDLAVWTSASQLYARAVVRHVFRGLLPLRFVWSAEDCTWPAPGREASFEPLKNLSRVKRRGYALDRVIVVDDTPGKIRRHLDNLVAVRPYTGEVEDDELVVLERYLLRLAGEEDLRRVDKTRWREDAGPAPAAISSASLEAAQPQDDGA